jgi:hypothetical protein
MIYCYPDINGKKERHQFFENWSEVPVSSFIDFSKIALELDAVNEKIIDIYEKLFSSSEALQIAKINSASSDKIKALERDVKKLQRELEPLLKEQKNHELAGVSLFCSIPVHALAEMKSALIVENDKGEMIEIAIDDNHFQAYKNRFKLLSRSQLPEETINEFYFQTKSDNEIKELQRELKSLGLMKVLSRRGRALKATIKSAQRSKYIIKDIWLQTTLANKEFQELANRIINQFDKGDFSDLIFLIAMLTIESNQETEELKRLREDSTAQTYLEKYREKFLEIFKERVKIFSEQELKLDVATVIRIKNFFLLSYKKYLRTSQQS